MAPRDAAALDELWEGELRGVVLAGRPVALVRLPEGVRAYEDRCPHLGVPLSEGTLQGRTLTCRAHGFQYDAATGRGVNPRTACLRPLPVLVEGGRILVEVEEPKVGPVLEASGPGRAVAEAISRLNPAAEVRDRGAYLRVLVPGACRVTREAIEQVLGEPFQLPADLEKVMPSFQGRFAVTAREARWEAGR